MNGRLAVLSCRKGIQKWPLIAALLCSGQFCALQLNGWAEPVAAHQLEGTIHGYLTLKTEQGSVVAVGDVLQVVHGDRVTSHVVFHFKDGSLDDETAVFSQRARFQLISDHHIQKGPFYPHPMDLTIDARSGEVTTKSTDKDGKVEIKTEHMSLPPDLYNGMIIPIMKNIQPDTSDKKVSMIVTTPKPRLVKLAITRDGQENFSLAGTERKAVHYEIRIELGGVAGVVAPLVGKAQPDIHVWIEAGQIPGFVGEQGPLSEDGPVVSIQQVGPALPGAVLEGEQHSATGSGN